MTASYGLLDIVRRYAWNSQIDAIMFWWMDGWMLCWLIESSINLYFRYLYINAGTCAGIQRDGQWSKLMIIGMIMPIRYGSESCFGNLSQFSVSYYYVDRNVILREIIVIDDHSIPSQCIRYFWLNPSSNLSPKVNWSSHQVTMLPFLWKLKDCDYKFGNITFPCFLRLNRCCCCLSIASAAVFSISCSHFLNRPIRIELNLTPSPAMLSMMTNIIAIIINEHWSFIRTYLPTYLSGLRLNLADQYNSSISSHEAIHSPPSSMLPVQT